jgi:hydroxypyruvate reductase
VLGRFGAALPDNVREALACSGPLSLATEAPLFVIGDNATAWLAARAEAGARGYAIVDGAPLVGEAREVGRLLGIELRRLAQYRPVAWIAGGEPTVTRRGPGRGGRMLELALAAAIEINGLGGGAALVAFATDGADGSSGGAGAVVDGSTMARLSAAGFDAARVLAASDTARAFAALGDLLQTGPTGTNVCDLVLMLVR